MSLSDRKERQVRRLLDTPLPAVPQGLYTAAIRRGTRTARHRTARRRLLWLLLFAAAVAFTVWAAQEQPWVEPPLETTPPFNSSPLRGR